MGLMSFKGDQPTLGEAKIAKNYLNEKELRAMGRIDHMVYTSFSFA